MSLMRPVPAAVTMRAGIIAGTGAFGLPSTCSISGKGFFRVMVMVLAPFAAISAPAASSIRPRLSRGAQRLSDATQSAAVTGAPSWKRSPSRSANRQVSPSAETSCASTICGWIAPASSWANRVSQMW